jgi:hypothetical protein
MVIAMVNKIVLAVCTTVVMAASAKLIDWLREKLDDDAKENKKKLANKGRD